MILSYGNRQLVAMAAILIKKNFLRWNFLGLFTVVLSGHPSNFPKNFSFLHFFQVGMIFQVMLLDYKSVYSIIMLPEEVLTCLNYKHSDISLKVEKYITHTYFISKVCIYKSLMRRIGSVFETYGPSL